MVPGRSRPCCSPCRNLPPIDPVEIELAGSVPLDFTPGSVQSQEHTPALPTPTPTRSTEELFELLMKTYMESVKNPVQSQSFGPRKRPLKAWFPDLYYRKSHLDCYQFCQQCENHFRTASATGPNRIPFAATFLRETINFCWHQYKR